MAARADKIDDQGPAAPREAREGEAPVPFPPRPVAEEPIEDVIARAVDRQREALEILARR